MSKVLLERTLTPLPTNRRPTFYDIRQLQTECIEILTLIPSASGGGNHGHTYLACRPGTQDWQSRTNNAQNFQPPQDPGPHAIVPNGTNALEERRIVREHEGNKLIYTVYREAIALIVTKLIAAASIYLTALKHSTNGFANITPMRMFTHLYATYGVMTDKIIGDNNERLNEPFDPNSQQIEVVINRFQDAQQVAANDEPISERLMVRKFVQVMTKTGVFNSEVKEWNGRMVAHKTWNHCTEFWIS